MNNKTKTIEQMREAHKVLSTFDFEPGKIEKLILNGMIQKMR